MLRHATRAFVLLLVLSLLGPSAAAQATLIHRVDASAPPGGDGLSWPTAFDTLQAAIAANGQQIWIAAGTYAPDAPGASRSSTFLVRDGIDIYGGFAGFETSLNQRNPAANVTVLSGDLAGDDGPGFANRGDNVHHVIQAQNLVNGVRLDGLTIRGGQADVDGASMDLGGGVLADNSRLVLSGCIVTDNFALEGGGGACARNGTNLTVERSQLRGNAAAGDPAATVRGGALLARSCNVDLSLCVFDGNSVATGDGGAVALELAVGRVSSCVMINNMANPGNGGALAAVTSHPTIEFTRFDSNVAQASGSIPGAGAGVYVLNSASSPRIDDCTFSSNLASSGAGGGLSLSGNSPSGSVIARVSRCVFSTNFAPLGSGGGVHLNALATAVLLDSVLVGNDAQGGAGGGIAVDFATCDLINCVLAGNIADQGGGAWIGDTASPPGGGTGTFVNCVLSGNSAQNVGGNIANVAVSSIKVLNTTVTAGATTPLSGCGGIYTNGASSTRIQNSIVSGNSNLDLLTLGQSATSPSYSIVPLGTNGTGNVFAPPVFVNPAGADGVVGTADDDVHLAAGSSGIDAGSNGLVFVDRHDIDGDGNAAEAIPVDFDYTARRADDPAVPDTGSGAAGVVDMGAFERISSLMFPGTGEDFALRTGVDSIPNPIDRKTPVAGNTISIHVSSSGGTFALAPFAVGLELFPTGSPPAALPGFPAVYLGASALFLIGFPAPATLPFDGFNGSGPAPPGLAGVSALLQGVVASPLAANGFFATTHGHELAFQ